MPLTASPVWLADGMRGAEGDRPCREVRQMQVHAADGMGWGGADAVAHLQPVAQRFL